MKKLLLIIFTLISFQLYAIGTVTGGIAHEMPDWFKQSFLEIEEDIAEASADNKHIMLFLHLNNCPYCAKMVDDLTNNKDKISKNFDIIAINIKGDKEVALNKIETMTEKELAQMLGIKYTPTIVFLNKKNNIVVRINGYRQPKDFNKVLEFVKDKHYKTINFTQYNTSLNKSNNYKFITNKNFKKITDFSKIYTPLAIIFESTDCVNCQYFHNTTLKNNLIKKEFKKYTITRLNADSNEIIITPKGKKMRIKDFVNELEITYRPGIVLFVNNEEKSRIDGFLYTWHFSEMLRFIANNLAERFSSYGQYLDFRQQELTKKGISINIVK